MNLTRAQVQQLANESTTLIDWMLIRDYCTQMYGGGRVAKVEIEIDGEYNDEGGTNYYIESVAAYDANGARVPYDLSQPFWSSETVLYWERVYTQYDEDDEELHPITFLRDLVLKEEETWLLLEDLPCNEDESNTYDLTTMPPFLFLVEPLT
jgi:hypothetical protein